MLVHSKHVYNCHAVRHMKSSFYKEHDLHKYDNKNVIYVAYIGNINNEPTYKYGKSAKLYEREYNAHRKNFDIFEMNYVRITDNKDVVEEIIEKEFKIRNIYRCHVINSKRQTELFTINEQYDLEYVLKLVNRVVKNNPSHEVQVLKEKLKKMHTKLKYIQ